jgi:azurin
MAELCLGAVMSDFVGAAATHRYVQELEARVEALERLVSALEQRSVEVASELIQPAKPKSDRKEYMRNFMAERRRREREAMSAQ